MLGYEGCWGRGVGDVGVWVGGCWGGGGRSVVVGEDLPLGRRSPLSLVT